MSIVKLSWMYQHFARLIDSQAGWEIGKLNQAKSSQTKQNQKQNYKTKQNLVVSPHCIALEVPGNYGAAYVPVLAP